MRDKSPSRRTLRQFIGTLGYSFCLMIPVAAGAQPFNEGVSSLKRYKIEALSFKAIDESGPDWPGSDEVMVATSDAKGSTVSNENKNIDSGDTHHFDPRKSCIVGVRPGVVVLGETSVCHDLGEPAPLSFGVQFVEKDFLGLPVELLCGSDWPPPPPGRHRGPHCADDGNGDDFLGRARLDFSVHELEAALPNVGDEVTETVRLHLCPEGMDVCSIDAEYSFTYRVTRMPDAVPQNHPTPNVERTSDAAPAPTDRAPVDGPLAVTEGVGAQAPNKDAGQGGMGDTM